MTRNRLVCVTCGKSFKGRADARYCSTSCRQRAYRERSNLADLERQLKEARLRYWEAARRLATARGSSLGDVMTGEAQLVDEDGNVFMHGEQVGTTTPDRAGWAAWGLEAGGPPFSPPLRRDPLEPE
jgi:hypothetical protein